MKKLLALLIVGLLVSGCTKPSNKTETTSGSNIPKQTETTTSSKTEVTEGTLDLVTETDIKYADLSKYDFVEEESKVQPLTLVELTEKIGKEDSNFLVFLGYANCGWCQRAMPVFNKLAGVDEGVFYYVNIEELVTEEEYQAFVKKTKEFLKDGELYVPLVLGVKAGEVQGGHLSLVSSFDPRTQDSMTNEQVEELMNIYRSLVE